MDGTDVVVRTELGTADTELSGAGGAGLVSFDEDPAGDFEHLKGVQASASYTRATAVARTGDTVLGISLESLASDQTFQWQRWTEGRAPTPGQPEIGLTRHTLDQLHIRLGDLVSIGNPVLGAANFRVTGVVDVRGSLEYSNAAYGIVPRADGSTVRGRHRGQRRAPAHRARQRERRADQGQRGGPGRLRPDHEGADRRARARPSRPAWPASTPCSSASRRWPWWWPRSCWAPRSWSRSARADGTWRCCAAWERPAPRPSPWCSSRCWRRRAGQRRRACSRASALARAGLPLTGLIPGLPAVSGTAFTRPGDGAGDRARRRRTALAGRRAAPGLGREPDPTGRRALEHDHPLLLAP